MSSRFARWAPAAVVVGLSLAVYANAVPNGFVFDDASLIVQNQPLLHSALREREWLAWLGRHYYWGSEELGGAYRPVTILTYVANLRASGLSAPAFHAVNVALHAAVGVLVLAFGRRLVGGRAAFLGAALFAVHPLHTEAVTGIVGRAELLAALFGLAALLCALRAAEPEERRWIAWTAAGAGLFLLALLSKEHVATLSVWLALALAPRLGVRPSRRALVIVGVLAAVALAHVAIWQGVIFASGGRGLARRVGEGQWSPVLELNNPSATVPVWQRWLTAAAVTARYAWLFVWPARLSPDYSYAEILASQGVGPLEAAGIVLVLLMLAVPVLAYRRQRGFALAVAFIPVAFLVVSNFPFRIGTIMGERLIYLATVGGCLTVGWVLARLGWPEEAAEGPRRAAPEGGWRAWAPAPGWRGWAVAGLCLAALAGYGARTVVRNRDWRDEYTLFTAAREAAPRSTKVMWALGILERQRGRFDRAEALFEEALGLAPWHVGARVALGDLYMQRRQPERAAEMYREAMRWAPPRDVSARVRLAGAHLELGRPDLAIEEYRAAIAAAPTAVEPRHNLGGVLWKLGRLEEAEAALREAVRVRPAFLPSRVALGWLLLTTGRAAAASEELRAALLLNPAVPRALHGMALAARQLGDAAAAREYARRAAAAGARPQDPGGSPFEPALPPAR